MSTTFTRQDFSLGTAVVDLGIADVNGDGKLDLVVSNLGTTAKLLILTGDGSGGFSTSTDLDITNDGTSMGFVEVADMDGDGDLDVVYDSYYNFSIRVMLRDGAGGYTSGTPVSFGSRPMAMRIGDVNGDGKKDVVALHQSGAFSVLLGDGQGGFQTPITNTSIQHRFATTSRWPI